MQVFPNGKAVILVTYSGIFYIDENSYKLLHGVDTTQAEENEDDDSDTPQAPIAGEPQRPNTVPAEARWNAAGNEWETGKNNADGDPIGEWKWWLAPKGYLCCHTIYQGEEGNVMSFTCYHEDGTPSRIGTYIDGQPFGTITWIRSDSPTIEQYPPNAGPNVWKTISTIKNGYTIEEHYYDKEGKEIQELYIGDVEISELMKKMGVMDRFYIDKDWKRLLAEAHEVLDENVAGDDDDDNEEQEEDRFEFISYPNATLSPDGKYIVLGSQMSSHIVL